MNALRKIREAYWLYLIVLTLCVLSCLAGIALMTVTAIGVCKAVLP